MKFIGGIPSNAKSILFQILKKFDKNTNFVIGTSGSFTIESILISLGFCNIYSNDISLLSYSYGKGAVGEIVNIKIQNDFFDKLREFENRSIEDNLAILLTIYQASEYCTFAPYQKKSNFDFMKQNLINIFNENKKKAQKTLKNIKIKGFIGKDICSILDKNFLKDKIIISFIPTYDNGYEKIYDFLEKSISWNKIPYTRIGKNNYEEINQKIVDYGGIAFLDRESSVTDCISKCKGAGKALYIHTKILKNKFFLKNSEKFIFYKIKHFEGNFKEVKNIDIKFLHSSSFNKIRREFISLKNDILGSVEYPFGVFLDGKLIGLIGIDIPKLNFSVPNILLKTDLSVINKNRVSKLIPMLACSYELMEILNTIIKRKYNYNELFTIVKTSKPISMKYRGIATLLKRDEINHRLVYVLKRNNLTFKEIYQKWLEKYYQN